MKRIIIICEGPTEREFCKNILQPHFYSKQIYLVLVIIKKSNGGIIPWEALKTQIENHLVQEKSVIVTTLIDYYGIEPKHRFPEWVISNKIADKNLRMEALEDAMEKSVRQNLSNRFIPYIQLHEFEGLLFNNIEIFNNIFSSKDFLDKSELERTINDYPNPELINDSVENSPSHRLSRIIDGYKKVVYGAILAESTGLVNIRNKSPRFNSWITKLENT